MPCWNRVLSPPGSNVPLVLSTERQHSQIGLRLHRKGVSFKVMRTTLPVDHIPAVRRLMDGRPVRARTADLYRVNYEVQKLNPFACLAFPVLPAQKLPINRLVLVTSW